MVLQTATSATSIEKLQKLRRQRPKRMPLRRGARSSVFVCVHTCVYNYISVPYGIISALIL